MQLDKIKIGKKYRIKLENRIVRAVVVANNASKKSLKLKTKDGIKEYKYSAIKKIQSVNIFRFKMFVLFLLTLFIGFRLFFVAGQVMCPHGTSFYCVGLHCRCESLVLKPVVYLYPEQTTKVTVELGYPKNITHSYPKYKKNWQVQAESNGVLTDSKTGRHYYALYWEGKKTETRDNPSEGFIVKGKNTISFLEEKLELLGLNEREAEEFIIYWLPKLEDAPYNFIRFQSIEEQNKNMPLIISPNPKTVIRVMMEYSNLEKPVKVKEQVLPQKPSRDGFTVVEWGGTKIDL